MIETDVIVVGSGPAGSSAAKHAALGGAKVEIAANITATQVDKSDVVVYTRDTHGDNYFETQEGKNLPVKHCIKGEWGWEIVDELNPHCILIKKY